MTSGISSIYTALAAVSVSAGGQTPTVYGLSSIPAHASSAITPCRLLLPMGNNPTGADNFGFIAMGTTARVNWTVIDLLLWEASEQGTGLAGAASDLVAYCGAYVDAMRTFREPTTQSSLLIVNCTPGIYEYPSMSGNWYKGVLSTLTVEEVLSG